MTNVMDSKLVNINISVQSEESVRLMQMRESRKADLNKKKMV